MDPDQEKKKVIKLVQVGTIFWIIGLLMVISAIVIEFTIFKPALAELHENPKEVWETATRGDRADLVDLRITANSMGPMLLTLKLGGIGLILSGIFLALVAIVGALGTMPEKLGTVIWKG